MIRKRFSGLRPLRIVTWTAVLIGWVTAAIGRLAVASPPAAPAPDPEPTVVLEETAAPTPLPVMPQSGLLVIRHERDPAAAPEPVVRRVVVEKVVTVSTGTPARSKGS